MDTSNISQNTALFDLVRRDVLFQELSNEQLSKVFAQVTEENFQTGSIIIQEGTLGKELYIIRSGAVEVVKVNHRTGQETQLSTFGPGDSFGEMGLIENAARTATVRTTLPTTVWVLTGVALEALQYEKDIMASIYKGLAYRLGGYLRFMNEMVAVATEKVARRRRFQGILGATILLVVLGVGIAAYSLGSSSCVAELPAATTPTPPI